MTDGTGLRERKRQQTRRAIVEAGLRLFETKGYAATTVPEIAAAAEISRATFFNYFPSKQDVVFADRLIRIELFRDAFSSTGETDTPAQALQRAAGEMLDATAVTVLPSSELVAVRGRLMATVPELRAHAMLEVAEFQREMCAMLLSRFPDDLDEFEAAAMTGAVVGAVLAVVGNALKDHPPTAPLADLVRRAIATALRTAPEGPATT